MAGILLYAKIFFIFVVGMIIGRITMAIQYAIMKPKKQGAPAANSLEEERKTVFSKEADKFYTSEATISLIKPLNSIDLKNKS